MTQTAFSIETLAGAFPGIQPSPKEGGAQSGSVVHKEFPLRNLQALIEAPLGFDRSADTLRFACTAAREGWSKEQIKALLLDPEQPISAHCLEQLDSERAADRAINKAFEDLPAPELVMISPTPYVWVAPEDIPPLDWLFGHWLLRQEVTFLVAPGGVGKTTLLTGTAMSLATGRDFLGRDVPGGPKRVWLWNLEDSVAMMTRTVQATARLYGIKPGDLAGRLFLDTSRDGTPLCTATRTPQGLKVSEPVHQAVVEALRARDIDVLIVDPFVSSHEGNENDNGEMDRVAKAWCRVAQEANCAIVLCHHASKQGSNEVNTMSARGAVALTAAARVVLVLNSMNKEEGDRLGVDPEERQNLIQVTMDKSNRAPPEKGNWYQKMSVHFPCGDSTAAIRSWSPPKVTDLLTPGSIAAIMEAFGNEGLRKSEQSPEWAGYVVAEALGLETPDQGTSARGKIKRVLAELMKQGLLLQVTIKDPRSKNVPGLRVARPTSPLAQGGVEAGGVVENGEE